MSVLRIRIKSVLKQQLQNSTDLKNFVIVASESGTTTLDYKIKYIDEENIKVIYKEEYRTKEGKIYDGFFYKRNLKKKANMYLDQLQEYMNTEE